MGPWGGGEIPPPFGPSKNVPIKSSVPKPPTQSIPTRLCVCVVYSFDLSQWCKQRNSDDGHSFRQLAPVLPSLSNIQRQTCTQAYGRNRPWLPCLWMRLSVGIGNVLIHILLLFLLRSGVCLDEFDFFITRCTLYHRRCANNCQT